MLYHVISISIYPCYIHLSIDISFSGYGLYHVISISKGFSQSLSIFPFTKHTSHIFARLFRAQRCTLLRHAMLKLRDRSSLSEGSSYMYKRSSRKYWHQKLRCFCVTKQKPTWKIWKIRISQHILKRQPKQEAIFTSSTPYSPIPDILSICWIFLAHWHISQSDKSHASTLNRNSRASKFRIWMGQNYHIVTSKKKPFLAVLWLNSDPQTQSDLRRTRNKGLLLGRIIGSVGILH